MSINWYRSYVKHKLFHHIFTKWPLEIRFPATRYLNYFGLLFFILGDPGVVTSNSEVPTFQSTKTSTQIEQTYLKQGTKYPPDLHAWSKMWKNLHFGLFRGGGGAGGSSIIRLHETILLPSYPLNNNINDHQSTYKIWKQSGMDF